MSSHKVEVTVILSFRVSPTKKDLPKKGKKTAIAKGKLEMKTKELSFSFESSEENYLSFLSELLKAHGHDKYTPVKKHGRFSIKVLIGKKAYVSYI